MGFKKLFGEKLEVVNIGLERFKDDLEMQNKKVEQVDWTPPASIDKKILDTLEANKDKIIAANEKVLKIILNH